MFFHSPIIGRAGGSGLLPQSVFATSLYTGDNTSRTITNGLNLSGQGGMVWFKGRSGTEPHVLFDTVRGAGNSLSSNSTGANDSAGSRLTAFGATGFDLGADFLSAEVNGVSRTYASWSFRRASKFFDVVTYTGDGTNRTIAHNLGTAPGMIIVKCLNTGGTNWQVYHRSVGATKYMMLNSANAETTSASSWNNTSPSSTVFSLGTDSEVNFSGWTYVAYLFAHDASADGIVQCGGISGLGYGSTTNITLGWQPQFLLAKPTTQTGPWAMLDTARGWVNPGTDARLSANTSATENTSDQFGHPLSTGFQLRGFDDPANGSDYIYLAIRAPI